MHITSSIQTHLWQKLLDKSPTASFFQSPECYDFYSSLNFLKPFVFAVLENEKLMAVMCGYLIADGNSLKSYFSRRAIVPGGLLLDTNISAEATQKLVQHAIQELKNQAIYIEIRNYNDYSIFRKNIESAGFKYTEHFDIHVVTSNLKSVLSGLSETKRRQLKTAQKNDVTWSETTQSIDVIEFYACLRKLYTSKIKMPLFPVEFFQKLVLLNNGKLLVVKQNGKIIGGMACVILANKKIYEWFVCGDETVEKTFYPSVVATWAGLECAVNNNIPCFDFMGAGKPDKEYGVREFKSKFGGELLEYGRFLYICNPKLYNLGKWMLRKIKM